MGHLLEPRPPLQLPLPIIATAATATLFVRTWQRDLPSRTAALIVIAFGLLGLSGIGALARGGETTTREVSFKRSNH
jgi:hypothetical protein